MNLFRRKPAPKAISRQASLQSKPLRNPNLETERDENGATVLLVPPNPARWASFVRKRLGVDGKPRRICLDELGGYVWEQCDGKTEVRAIITNFAKRFKLNRKEAELSIVEYLRTLARKGIIGIIVPDEKPGG